MSNHLEVANIIASQMGGTGSLVMMLGAKHFMACDDKLGAFSFHFGKGGEDKSGKPVNYCKITLDPSDTYTMTFGYIRGTNYTVRAEVEGIYNDGLMDTFESNTGMFLTFKPRR